LSSARRVPSRVGMQTSAEVAAPPRDDDRLTRTALYRAVLLGFGLAGVVQVFPLIAGMPLLLLLVVIVAVPLSRAADALERLHVPRVLGVFLVLLGVLELAGVAVATLSPIVVDQGNRLIHSLAATITSRCSRHISSSMSAHAVDLAEPVALAARTDRRVGRGDRPDGRARRGPAATLLQRDRRRQPRDVLSLGTPA
jgi:hypothetical protein